MCSMSKNQYGLISINPRVYFNEYLNDVVIVGDNIFITMNTEEEEDISDDDDVIIVFDDMSNTIKQIEENILNGIELSDIFISIQEKDEDTRDDIWSILMSIYDKINFIFDYE